MNKRKTSRNRTAHSALAENLIQGISNEEVRKAFSAVDRSLFVPESLQREAWADHPLPIEDEATISQPSLVAQMTEWLDVRANDRVLEIGTGSGYQTAILAELAREVATVEYSSILSRTAKERLEKLGYDNIHFRVGDGMFGWQERAPYDRIMATVAFSERPDALLDQLDPGDGVALVPVGLSNQPQYLTLYRLSDGRLSEERLLPVRFLSLR